MSAPRNPGSESAHPKVAGPHVGRGGLSLRDCYAWGIIPPAVLSTRARGWGRLDRQAGVMELSTSPGP